MKRIIAMIMVLVLISSWAAFAAEYTDKPTVKRVQQALNENGYACGTPDGSAGKKTRQAIKAFRKDRGLEVTEAIDDELIEALGILEPRAALTEFDPRLPEPGDEYWIKFPNMWAGFVYLSAMLKLTDDGVLDADPVHRSYPLKKNLEGTFPMIFKNKNEGKKLTDPDFRLGPGRVMIIREDHGSMFSNGGFEGMSPYGLYGKLDNGSSGYIAMRGKTSECLDIPAVNDRVTANMDECDYVIQWAGYKTLADEEYYYDGSDRYGMTMIVFVIDARDMTCLHIECVSTDLPGDIARSNVGSEDQVSAEEYIVELLEG